MDSLIWNWSGEPKEAPLLLGMACARTKCHGEVLLPRNMTKAGESEGVAFQSSSSSSSGGGDQDQYFHTGVSKFSLLSQVDGVFVGHNLKLFLFFLDRSLDESRGANLLLARVFESSHNSCSSLCITADDRGGFPPPHIIIHSADSVSVPATSLCFLPFFLSFAQLLWAIQQSRYLLSMGA